MGRWRSTTRRCGRSPHRDSSCSSTVPGTSAAPSCSCFQSIDCRVQWIDEREDQFPATPLALHIEKLCVEPVEAEVHAAPPGAFFLVLTHSHDLRTGNSNALFSLKGPR